MKKLFARWVMKMAGWKLSGEWPASDKCVMVVAPHTSLLDWWWGVMGYWSNGKKANYLIKGKYFFFPLGAILRASGGIPVFSGKNKNFIPDIIKHVKKTNKLYLTITPEGTRKKVKRWRIGFYKIALELNLPILLGCIDYKNKEMRLMTLFYPTGDMESDLENIYSYYYDIEGRHPECFCIPQKKIKR